VTWIDSPPGSFGLQRALAGDVTVAGSFVGWNVPNTRSHIAVLMPKFTTC
jgi:hypothetical protein